MGGLLHSFLEVRHSHLQFARTALAPELGDHRGRISEGRPAFLTWERQDLLEGSDYRLRRGRTRWRWGRRRRGGRATTNECTQRLKRVGLCRERLLNGTLSPRVPVEVVEEGLLRLTCLHKLHERPMPFLWNVGQ